MNEDPKIEDLAPGQQQGWRVRTTQGTSASYQSISLSEEMEQLALEWMGTAGMTSAPSPSA